MRKQNLRRKLAMTLLLGISAVQATDKPVHLDPHQYHVRLSTREHPGSIIENQRTNMATQVPTDRSFCSEINNVYVRNNKTGECITPKMVQFLEQFSGLHHLTIRCDDADTITFPPATDKEEYLRKIRGWRMYINTLTLITEAPNLNEALEDLPESMPGLNKVTLYSDHITKEGIGYIAQLRFLEKFWLNTGRVTIEDDALTPLADHPQLGEVLYGATTKKGEEPALRALYESRQNTKMSPHPLRYVNGRSCEAYDFTSPPVCKPDNFTPPPKKSFWSNLFGHQEAE